MRPIKRSPTDWALRWIWNHPEVTCVLSGMNMDEHIEENISIASDALLNSITLEEIKLVERVRDLYNSLMKVPCTGCAYCMPCPAGVNIPGCFEKYNNKYLFGGIEQRAFYLMQLGGFTGKPAKASQCVNCGKCEEHCPQHIEIRKELKKVASKMEGFLDIPLAWILKRRF